MKHFISYTILILLGIFLSSGLLLNNVKKKKQKRSPNDSTEKIKKDTSVNKLPEGYLYITNFNLSKPKKIRSVCSDSIGVMAFSDNSGITFFDGETETRLKIEDSPNVIKKDKNLNVFYAACNKGYGYIAKDKTNNYVYHSLSNKLYDKQSYNNVIIRKNEVFFSGTYKIVKYNLKTKKISEIYFDDKKPITGLFNLNNKLYINILNNGLYLINEEKITSVNKDSLFNSSEILFAVSYKKNVILGMSNNKLYLFDGENYSPYDNKASEYIKESIINGGKSLNTKQFVVTTLNGGAIIFDKETGNVLNTINYRTGLPDDEIFAAAPDLSGGLWLAHEYGVSRAAIELPVRNFNLFPGLQGNINAVKFYDNTLYVATGEGLFRLSEIKSYEEVEVAEKKQVKYLKKIKYKNNNSYSENNIVVNSYNKGNNEEQIESGNFFQRWKKRKEKKKKKNISDKTDTLVLIKKTKKTSNKQNKISYKTEYKTITEYKKIYELHSVKYIYKKTEGINSKCKKITNYKNGILINTNSGLYFIKDSTQSIVISDAYIFSISCNSNSDIFYAVTSEGLYKIHYLKGSFAAVLISGNSLKETVLTSVYKISDSLLWASGNRKLFLFKISGIDILSAEQFDIDTDFDEDIIITKKDNHFIFLTNSKAYYYNKKYNNILEDSEITNFLTKSDHIFILNDTAFTINSGSKILYKNNVTDSLKQLKYAWIFNQIKSVTVDNNGAIWLISGHNNIFKLKKNFTEKRKQFKIFLTNIKDFKGNSFIKTSFLKLKSSYKNITVHLSAPDYLKKGSVRYLYGIDISEDSEYLHTDNPYFSIPELSPGKHLLSFYAINSLNEKSQTIKIIIVVKPPIWQTTWFIIAVFSFFLVVISLGLSVFYKKKQRKIKEYNEILELKVKERTIEIEQQNKLIQEQNLEIFDQYKKIDFQNKEITGSIRYAGKIQKAALSEIGIYTKYVSEFFILFKPRDIVSGDFYWVNETKNKLLIATVDCTGHGVPGGFLSMLGISFLNEIVKDINKTRGKILAADILNELREKIITTLSTHEGEEERKDGMDMSIAIIDKENMQLNFAGANNPAYIIRNEQITKLEADRMPVGNNKKLNHIPFKNKYIKLKNNDNIYLFSDGYADQFGGINQKKFNSRRFREMLLHIHNLPMSEQEIASKKILRKWMGDTEQIDDILLIGIKI